VDTKVDKGKIINTTRGKRFNTKVAKWTQRYTKEKYTKEKQNNTAEISVNG
jgi:hypothetical protein